MTTLSCFISSEPHAPPLKLRLVDTTSTSILVTWDEVPPTYQNGIILSYTVWYRAIDGIGVNAPVYNKTVESPTMQANLTGLIKNQKYTIAVLATTVKGDGPCSHPISVTANQDSKGPAYLTRYYNMHNTDDVF